MLSLVTPPHDIQDLNTTEQYVNHQHQLLTLAELCSVCVCLHVCVHVRVCMCVCVCTTLLWTT